MNTELVIRSAKNSIDIVVLKEGRLIELHQLPLDQNLCSVFDIYLAKVKKVTNQNINTKDKVFGDYTAKQNTNDKQNILKSYDLLLNKKYNVVLNEKTIERVKNFFK